MKIFGYIAIVLIILFGTLPAYGAVRVVEWELGDEISPYPFAEGIDCDDGTLYSYYYVIGADPDLDIKIMWGRPWAHVWLEVSDNETTFVYDYGQPYEKIPEIAEIFKGREISLRHLIGEVLRDLD